MYFVILMKEREIERPFKNSPGDVKNIHTYRSTRRKNRVDKLRLYRNKNMIEK